ncbi:universal stress protein [Zobellia alginiliquefaciens]|uniref:universal stress protein n=1 Tax=Zobellia alginiliquefaciens TaxID=3032586 RepID=UPI0023E3B235|nr:universal stress protein [Zobellia alginiliquefaciens]
MRRTRHKIAVFSDLTDSMLSLLKSSVSLAQMIDGEIEVFNVTKPTQIIGKDNQLSAIRTINREYILTDKRMRDIVSPISEDYGVPISYTSTFGNVKAEIARYLSDNEPDVIVLGRKKIKPFNTINDRITNFVLRTFKGSVMIVSEQNSIEPGKKIGIGMLNCSGELNNSPFSETLFTCANSPLKSFNIIDSSKTQMQPFQFLGQKTVNYVFDYNQNTIKTLPTYLSMSNIDLLFIERKRKENHSIPAISNMYDMAKKLGVTLMITGEKRTNYEYQSNLQIA